jgi:biopolymer transport protein ExbB
VIEYFIRGGQWMWPILICSVLALAVIIYKLWEFWRLRGQVDELISKTDELASAGRYEEAVASLQENQSPAAAILREALAHRGQERTAVREAMDNAGQAQLGTLESGLASLSTIASIAPLLGFLGTVTGMIEAFSRIQEVGLGDPKAVAAGISKALITTASGLIVAIPTFAAYNYFVTRVKRFTLDMERASAHGITVATQGDVSHEV